MTNTKITTLSEKLYDFLMNEDPSFETAIGSLELVKLWITKDYITL